MILRKKPRKNKPRIRPYRGVTFYSPTVHLHAGDGTETNHPFFVKGNYSKKMYNMDRHPASRCGSA